MAATASERRCLLSLLHHDGTITSIEGYDPASGMWCENVPDLAELVPPQPTKDAAEAALRLVRETFKTFCFADAETLNDSSGIAVVDTSKAPGRDEVRLSGCAAYRGLSTEPALGTRGTPAGGICVGRGCW